MYEKQKKYCMLTVKKHKQSIKQTIHVFGWNNPKSVVRICVRLVFASSRLAASLSWRSGLRQDRDVAKMPIEMRIWQNRPWIEVIKTKCRPNDRLRVLSTSEDRRNYSQTHYYADHLMFAFHNSVCPCLVSYHITFQIPIILLVTIYVRWATVPLAISSECQIGPSALLVKHQSFSQWMMRASDIQNSAVGNHSVFRISNYQSAYRCALAIGHAQDIGARR